MKHTAIRRGNVQHRDGIKTRTTLNKLNKQWNILLFIIIITVTITVIITVTITIIITTKKGSFF